LGRTIIIGDIKGTVSPISSRTHKITVKKITGHIFSETRYLAFDEDGILMAFHLKPRRCSSFWTARSGDVYAPHRVLKIHDKVNDWEKTCTKFRR
jgi:hypothetical protein